MFRQCFKDLVNPLAFLKVGTLPYPTWFKRSREWGAERGEVAMPSENEFKNYSLPSAYSAKGSWKNETVVLLGKLSCLQSTGGIFSCIQVPAASVLLRRLKKKKKYRNCCPSRHPLAAVPWLGK